MESVCKRLAAMRAGWVSKPLDLDARNEGGAIIVEICEDVDSAWPRSRNVRKTFKRHGQGNERKQDQVGITTDDVVAAIEILRDPQNIRVTRSNNGKPSLEVSRRFADGMLYTAQITVADPGAIAL